MILIILANIRQNLPRLFLASLGVGLGLLVWISTTFYFDSVMGRVTPELPPVPIPADIVVTPKSTGFRYHSDVSYYEPVVFVKTSNAAGLGEVMAMAKDSQFLVKYQLLSGAWPRSADEIAVPASWLNRTMLSIGDLTPFTAHKGNFYTSTQLRISGVFESNFPTYNLPVITLDAYQLIKAQGISGLERYFVNLMPGADPACLADLLDRQQSAVTETGKSLALKLHEAAWQEQHGDAWLFGYGLSGLVFVVAGAGMANVLFLTMNERLAELGKLKTLGVEHPGVGAIFFAEGLIICILGLILALSFYVCGSLLLVRLGIVPQLVLTSTMVRHLLVGAFFLLHIPPHYPIAIANLYRPMDLLRMGTQY